MHLKISNSTQIKIFGVILGILIVSLFATLQHIMIFGVIKPKAYIIPAIVGSLSGFLIATWFSKLAEAKKEIETSHSRLKSILEGTEIGMWDWNPQTNDVKFDEQWCQLLGYSLEEIEPTFTSWESRVHPEDLKQCYKDIERYMNGETEFYNNVHRMKHKDGHWVYILDRGQIIEHDENNQPISFTGTHTDITHLKEVEKELEDSNKKLRQLTLIDGLTGLSNRRALQEYLIKEWAHWQRNQTPFSMLMIDIDCFKDFNDTYGHMTGDDCLKQVANILNTNVKRTNDMAARFGGEEFLIVLSGIHSHEAIKVAENIRTDIQNLAIPHSASTCHSTVTVSIGVSSCDGHCDSSQHTIEEADKALYQAKEQGRNRTVLYQK
ncbi:MAG: sensor domain-containing diguanylate cyclase [Pseudomonadota bacterium]|nr:sensor domain-containing diguanylate cyclase [Pseudomonadota bacterium]